MNVIIGILNASQNLTNLAAFIDALMSNTPANLDGCCATIPIDLPASLANPTIMFVAYFHEQP